MYSVAKSSKTTYNEYNKSVFCKFTTQFGFLFYYYCNRNKINWFWRGSLSNPEKGPACFIYCTLQDVLWSKYPRWMKNQSHPLEYVSRSLSPYLLTFKEPRNRFRHAGNRLLGSLLIERFTNTGSVAERGGKGIETPPPPPFFPADPWIFI